MDATTTFLVIEDQEIITWGLERMVVKAFKPAEVHSASDCHTGLQILQQVKINLVILDIDVPGSNSVETIQQFRDIQPDVKILVHSGLTELDYAPSYIMAGADGFVSKHAAMEDVIHACEVVLLGNKYLSPLMKRTASTAL